MDGFPWIPKYKWVQLKSNSNKVCVINKVPNKGSKVKAKKESRYKVGSLSDITELANLRRDKFRKSLDKTKRTRNIGGAGWYE